MANAEGDMVMLAVEPPIPMDSYSEWVCERLRQGSENLLRAMWRAHPEEMRLRFLANYQVIKPSKGDGPVTPKAADRGTHFFASELIDYVAEQFGFTHGELIGSGREKSLVEARAVIVRVLRSRGWSYPRIGKLLGGRDHSTIISADSRFDVYCKRNPLILATIAQLQKAVGNA